MTNNKQQGYVIEDRTGELNLQITTLNKEINCKITLNLRGKYELFNKNNPKLGNKKLLVNYLNFSINNRIYINSPTEIWHNTPLHIEYDEHIKDKISINVKWEKYYVSISEKLCFYIFIFLLNLSILFLIKLNKKTFGFALFIAIFITGLLFINNTISNIYIIGLTISSIYFTILKISNYYFKSIHIDQKGIINISFIIVFITILFIPMAKISNEKTSSIENRTLAIFPTIVNEKREINNNFGNEFNSWFNDRFFGKELLVKIHKRLQNINNIVKSGIYICMNKGDICFVDRIEKESLYYNHYKNFPEVLNQIQNKLKAKETIALFYPGKFYLYCNWSYFDSNKCSSILDEEISKLEKNLNKNPKVHLIGVYKVLKKEITNQNENSANYLNFIDDHHPTEYAHYKVINNLFNFIPQNNIFSFEEKNCVRGDSYNNCRDRGRTYEMVYLTMFGKRNDISYKYLSFSNQYKKCINVEDIPTKNNNKIKPILPNRIFTNNCVDNNIKVLVFGNSLSELFSRVLATKVKQVIRVRTHNGNDYWAYTPKLLPLIINKDISDFKPDYIFSLNMR